MKNLVLIFALMLSFVSTTIAQVPETDSEQMEQQLEMMKEQMTKLLEQLGSGMQDGQFFFMDTTFIKGYRDLEFDGLDEDGQVSPEAFGQDFETLSKKMMEDLLKMAEGFQDMPFFQELQPATPAPEEGKEGEQKSEQSEKIKKKRIVKTL